MKTCTGLYACRLFTRLALLVSMMAASVVAVPAGDLTKATLRLHWVPQAQFAGYYVALAKGFYKESGIDLEIRPGGPGISPLNNIASGKETFASEWLISGITFAAKGAPILNIAQMLQTSGLMLVSLKETGIETPQQMNGRTVGIWPGAFSLAPTVLFEQFTVRPKLVSQQFSMDEFLSGKLDVASAMIYNEYLTILQTGRSPSDLNTFMFKDYGLNFPEDGIYVHKDTLARDPGLCTGFVRASIRGWLYAFEHVDEALSIVMTVANEARTGTTAVHQARMMEEIKKMILFRVGASRIGELDAGDFELVMGALLQRKMISRPLELKNFHYSIQREE